MRKAKLTLGLVVIVSVMAGAISVWGQGRTASLTGLVTDPTGAAIPGAQVTIRNTQTNIEQTITTGESGYYTFQVLEVGSYEVVVEQGGFKRTVAEVVLQVGQKGRLDFALGLGAVTETITVEAATPLLTTEEATPGAVVESRMVSDLPLNLRNWDDLLSLVAGVQSERFTESGGGTSGGRTGGFNVHGVRSLQNNFILDGVDNNSISTNVQELTTQVARTSVDTIQEFKISTNPYNAEFGRSPGAAVIVTTKSGTNELHGTVYWFLRNENLDANTFFLNRAGTEKAKNRFNQGGFTVGGPIVKDRVFLFGAYEGTRIDRGVTRIGNSPMPNERIGDFSAAAAIANRIAGDAYATIFDRVGDCQALDPGAFNPDGSFKDNKIPPACIDPVAAAILDLVPFPNFTPTSGQLNTNNFLRLPGLLDDTDNYLIRGDWQVSPNHSVFARWTYIDRDRFDPGTFGGIIDGTSTSSKGQLIMKARAAAIGWTSTFGPRVVNEFRLGWSRNISRGQQAPFGQIPPAAALIPNAPQDPLFSGGFGPIRIQSAGGVPNIANGGGLDHIGSPQFLPKFQLTNQFQWSDTVKVISGPHQMSFGVDVRQPMRNIFLDIPALRGDIRFSGQYTGIGLADFLLGYPFRFQLANPAVVDARIEMFSFFFQDDWKATPKLTVNFGLRYDFAKWPFEGQDRLTNLNPLTGERFTAASAAGFASSTVGRSLVDSDKNNFAPRLGLAYQLTSKTVLRVGYGRFFQLLERAGSEDQLGVNLPWLVDNLAQTSSTTTTINNSRLGTTGFLSLSLDPNSPTLDVTQIRLRAINPDSVTPSVDQWNIGIQRLLPGDIVLTADYVGTKGTHQTVLRNLNQQSFDANGIGTGIAPFPLLGPIEYRDSMGNSNYHGLDFTVEKRFSQGLSFRGSYTFSKSIDFTQEHLFRGSSTSFGQNSNDIRGDRRGPSDFDVRHRLVLSYNYELPVGRNRTYLSEGVAAQLLGGWRISGITNMRTGLPFHIRARSNSGNLGGPRGGLVEAQGDCLRPARKIGSVDQWFDTSAFAVPAPALDPVTLVDRGRLGTCGRNTESGPGYINFDIGLARAFEYFGEGRNLEFRWEIFNLFNTPQFGRPNNNVSSSGFGQITSLSGDPRVMQFALKFIF